MNCNILAILLLAPLFPPAPRATAPYVPVPPIEAAAFSRPSTSVEISSDLAWIARTFPQARVDRLGVSVQGRPLEALVLTAAPNADVSRRDRVTVLVIGAQHGMEGAGAESLLFIARELLTGSLRHVLADIDVALIPNSNPDGFEINKRPNANGVNLNTDFVALTQPESRALVFALRRYRPEVVLDVHESAILKKKSLALEGYMTDFQAQFEFANNPNVVASLRAFALGEVLTPWIAGVDAAGLNAHRYFGEIRSARQPVTNGGLSLQNFRNRAGVEGALAFLMETRLDPSAGVYPTYQNLAARIAGQRISIERFLAVVHERREGVRGAVAEARRQGRTAPLALDVRYVADPADPPVAIHLRRIDDGRLERIEFANSRTVAAGAPLRMPAAYVVRAHQEKFARWFDRQGIEYRKLEKPRTLRAVEFTAGPAAPTVVATPVSTAGVGLVSPAAAPNPTLDRATERTIRLRAKPGDLWVDASQLRGRLAALLLEPRSDSTVLRTPEFLPFVAAGEKLPVYRVPR